MSNLNCLYKKKKWNRSKKKNEMKNYLIQKLYLNEEEFIIDKIKLSKLEYKNIRTKLENYDFFKQSEDFKILVGNYNCRWCTKAILLFNKNNIKYNSQSREDNSIIDKITRKYCCIPMIFYKNIFIGGYSDLKNFLKYYKNNTILYENQSDKYIINKILKKN